MRPTARMARRWIRDRLLCQPGCAGGQGRRARCLDRGLRQLGFVQRVMATHAAILAVAPPEEPDPDILRVALDV